MRNLGGNLTQRASKWNRIGPSRLFTGPRVLPFVGSQGLKSAKDFLLRRRFSCIAEPRVGGRSDGRRERGNWERRRHEKRMVKNGERRENQFRVITVYSPNDNPITASLKQYQG